MIYHLIGDFCVKANDCFNFSSPVRDVEASQLKKEQGVRAAGSWSEQN
jgi:hypothetical protein